MITCTLYGVFQIRPVIVTGLAITIALLKAGVTPAQADNQAWLRGTIETGRLSDLHWPGFASSRDALRQFYESNGFALAWLRGNQPAYQATALVAVLKAADQKGLNPEDYDGEDWEARLNAIRGEKVNSTGLARFDLELSIAAFRFVSDLHFGRVNPGTFHRDSDLQESHQLAKWIRDNLQYAKETPDAIPDAIHSIEPPFPAYRTTEAALIEYRRLLANNEPNIFPAAGKPVKPGDPYPDAARLYAFLHRLGDVPSSGAVPPDYSGALVDAIRRFQMRHGLNPDGVMGAATFRALNTPISQRVRQIELTLERWRWLPHEFPRPPLIVNIPRFELAALDDANHVVLRMKVIVGGAYGHKTPMFTAEMNSLIFHPYWDVPASIARKELQPKEDRTPGYFAKNHYEIVRDLNGATRIRQRPGSDNALGFLKFAFPNRFDVYMHGTPATELFSQSRRDFSHGCIRVEDPERLAEWVLTDVPGWSPDRIRGAIEETKTIQVKLIRPIPVLIVYGTAIVGEDGVVRFFDDIYHYDADLERTISAGRRDWM